LLITELAYIVVRRADIKIMTLTVKTDNGINTVEIHFIFISERLDEAAENRRAPSVSTLESDFLTVFLK
jgi:hypothetical protein